MTAENQATIPKLDKESPAMNNHHDPHPRPQSLELEVAKPPPQENSSAVQRQRLATLIGRLLARAWLREQQQSHGCTQLHKTDGLA
jgi:hypothetical protein